MIACALFEPFALWRATRETPELEDKALVTVKKNRVTHTSARAKSQGVEVGMSLEGARSRCALTVVEINPTTLQQAWGGLLAELYTITDRIECQKPGQAFLELREEDARMVAELFGVRIGMGSSQEQAHLLALTAETGEAKRWTGWEEVDALPIKLLTALGLSPKSVERLTWLGVKEVGQLRKWSRAHLSNYLGVEARTVSRYLKGPYRTEVARYTPPVVLSGSYGFEDAALEPWQIQPVLRHLCDSLAGGLGDRAASRLSLTAEAQGLAFNATRASKTLLRGTGVQRLALLALEDTGVLGLPIDELTLSLSGLYRPSTQGSLWQQRENLEKAVELVEARFPGAVLRIEALNPYSPVSEFSHRLIGSGIEVKRDSLSFERKPRKRTAGAGERQPSLISR